MYQLTTSKSTKVLVKRSQIGRPEIQTHLRAMAEQSILGQCLCSGSPGEPVSVSRGQSGNFHLRRMPGTGGQHIAGCLHSDMGSLSAAYGVPPGTFVDAGDQILINFKLLFPALDSSGTGGGQRKNANHGPALLSLMWLLLMRSGLNVSHPALNASDCWQDLRFAAMNVLAARGGKTAKLEDLLLLSVDAHAEQTKRNYAKLAEAMTDKLNVLVATLLPPGSQNQKGEELINLKSATGVPMMIFPPELKRALARFPDAKASWKDKKPVLALALAAPKLFETKDRSSLQAIVRQLALLPVSKALTPLPTAGVERRYDKYIRDGGVFSVGPDEDTLLCLWARRIPRVRQ